MTDEIFIATSFDGVSVLRAVARGRVRLQVREDARVRVVVLLIYTNKMWILRSAVPLNDWVCVFRTFLVWPCRS